MRENGYYNYCQYLDHPSVSLNLANIHGQSYDGAAVMFSTIACVQSKIKEISPLALCFSHSLNLSIASSSKVQEVRNIIGLINEAHLFLANSPK